MSNEVALELGRAHHVDQFDAQRAHEFVWRHLRQPYDLTIVELGDSDAYAFVWPYLFHYPGIVILRAGSLQHSRSEALLRARRPHHLRAERAFGGGDLRRAALTAARLVVVHDDAAARDLAGTFPDIRVRTVPAGAVAAPIAPAAGGPAFVVSGTHRDVVARAASRAGDAGTPVAVRGEPSGVHDGDVVARAGSRAGDDGTPVAVRGEPSGVHDGDVVIALEWPPSGAPPAAALRAMAAGAATIVFETEAVATWPALDPQTWQPRDYAGASPPIAVSIDPRDEEHSLMLAMRRLATDVRLRASLGAAAQAWARTHASVRTAAAAWQPVLEEAAQLAPPASAAALPPHLTEDGSAAARAILDEFGLMVDILDS